MATPPFAILLKRYRQARGWTQDDLAHRAGISTRTVSDIERGLSRFPRHDTVQLLVDALDLSDSDNAQISTALHSTTVMTNRAITPSVPLVMTTFVGREQDLENACNCLLQPSTRLLTLVGSAGIGKTRLSLEVAERLIIKGYQVVFVKLANVLDESGMVHEIARALEVREDIHHTLTQQLENRLAQGELILILDNFEHLIAAKEQITAMLANHSQLRFLITSQISLKIPNEQTLTIGALPYPPIRQLPSMPELAQYPAIALFVECARAASSDFALTAANGATIARICAKMQGIPLAIEIAATQVRVLRPSEILSQISQQAGRGLLQMMLPRTAEGSRRQQSLDDAIAWSYHLLDARLQTLFRRICVFTGNFALDAVEQICNPQGTLGIDCVEGLMILVDHHLVQMLPEEKASDEPRFALLDVLRIYGMTVLVQRQEETITQRQHATYYCILLERLGSDFLDNNQAQTLQEVAREYENILAALNWARSRQDVVLGFRLTGSLWWYWEKCRTLSEGRDWLEGMLSLYQQGNQHVTPALLIRVLYGTAILMTMQGDYLQARQLGLICLQKSEEIDDQVKLAWAEGLLGTICKNLGERESAITYISRSLTRLRTISSTTSLTFALNNLSALLIEQGDLVQATELLEEALDLKRQQGDQRGIAVSLINLSELLKQQHNYVQALVAAREAGVLFDMLGDQFGLAMALNNQGEILLCINDIPAALAALHESLHLFQQNDNRVGCAMVHSSIGDAHEQDSNLVAAIAAWQFSLEHSIDGSYASHCKEKLQQYTSPIT